MNIKGKLDQPVKNRVAIYARVSTHLQTCENQILDLENFCKQRGWTVKAKFIDGDISGAEESRPNLNQMMDLVLRRQFDAVLVWKLDRFARSVKHLVLTLDTFRDLKVDFISYQENIDTSTSQGRLLFHVMSALAEFERDLIRDRIMSGLRRAKSQGKSLGRPVESNEIMIGKAKLFRSKGMSIRKIAQWVDMSPAWVHAVLKRPA